MLKLIVSQNFVMISGPELPVSLMEHSMVTLGMGQAIIGGKSDGENQKKIYFLKCSNAGMMNVQENCNISPLGELSIARSAFVVIPIPITFTGCITNGKALLSFKFFLINNKIPYKTNLGKVR